MSHHRHTGTDNLCYCFDYFFATFKLKSISSGFLHDTNRVTYSVERICLIRTERHVNNHQCTLYTTHYRLAVINHLIDCNRQCSHIARHNVRCRITYQNNIYSSPVNNLGNRIIIRGQHGNFFTSFFHFNQTVSCHFSCITRKISCHKVFSLI